jgi:hypothetical protein
MHQQADALHIFIDDFVPALDLHCPVEGNKKSPSTKRKAIHMTTSWMRL